MYCIVQSTLSRWKRGTATGPAGIILAGSFIIPHFKTELYLAGYMYKHVAHCVIRNERELILSWRENL